MVPEIRGESAGEIDRHKLGGGLGLEAQSDLAEHNKENGV